jgi:hypothetical protein
MRYADDVPAEYFAAVSEDWWVCVCGNDPSGSGLAPATYDGMPSDDDPTYDSHGTTTCLDCGRYGVQEYVEVNGRRMVRVKGRVDGDAARAAWNACQS